MKIVIMKIKIKFYGTYVRSQNCYLKYAPKFRLREILNGTMKRNWRVGSEKLLGKFYRIQKMNIIFNNIITFVQSRDYIIAGMNAAIFKQKYQQPVERLRDMTTFYCICEWSSLIASRCQKKNVLRVLYDATTTYPAYRRHTIAHPFYE